MLKKKYKPSRLIKWYNKNCVVAPILGSSTEITEHIAVLVVFLFLFVQYKSSFFILQGCTGLY